VGGKGTTAATAAAAGEQLWPQQLGSSSASKKMQEWLEEAKVMLPYTMLSNSDLFA
jgi:hypothetical protein